MISTLLSAEVLHTHDQDDILSVVLKKPHHYEAFAVALHVGHRVTDIEWSPDPAHRDRVRDAGRRRSTSSTWDGVRPLTTCAASGTYSHVQSLTN